MTKLEPVVRTALYLVYDWYQCVVVLVLGLVKLVQTAHIFFPGLFSSLFLLLSHLTSLTKIKRLLTSDPSECQLKNLKGRLTERVVPLVSSAEQNGHTQRETVRET